MTTPTNDPVWLSRRKDNKLIAGQVAPRARSLVRDKQWWFIAPVWLVFYVLASQSQASALAIKDVALAEISMASLSFGACVTGLVLSLTINSDRSAKWARSGRAGSSFSHLSDLIFVFAWSAMAQLVMLASAFTSLLLGSRSFVYVRDEAISHRILLAIAVLVACYAFFQLISVLRSLVQIGVVTINDVIRSESTG